MVIFWKPILWKRSNAKKRAVIFEGEDSCSISITEYEEFAIAKLAYEDKKPEYEYRREELKLEIKYYEKLLKYHEEAIDASKGK